MRCQITSKHQHNVSHHGAKTRSVRVERGARGSSGRLQHRQRLASRLTPGIGTAGGFLRDYFFMRHAFSSYLNFSVGFNASKHAHTTTRY